MLYLLIGNSESTNSAPNSWTVGVIKGWRTRRKVLVLSCMGAVGVIHVAMATAIIAKARAALSRRGYSLAWEVLCRLGFYQ